MAEYATPDAEPAPACAADGPDVQTVTLTYGLVLIDGHEYARDRGPYDDPIGRVRWRRRWVCSCGRSGDWKLRNDEQTYHDWAWHAGQAGRRRAGPHGYSGAMVDESAVPRSTDHRSTS